MPGPNDNAPQLPQPPYLQPLIISAHLAYQKLCQSIFTGRVDMSTPQMKALTKLADVVLPQILTIKVKNKQFADEISLLQRLQDKKDSNFNAIFSILQTCAYLVTTEITENLFQIYFVHLKAQRKLLEVALNNEEHTFFKELDLFFQFLEVFNRVQYKARASLKIAQDEKKKLDELSLDCLTLESQLKKEQEESTKARQEKESLAQENRMLRDEIEQSCKAKDTLFANNEKLFQETQNLTRELIREREQKLALQKELAALTLKAEKSKPEAENFGIQGQVEQPQKLTRTSSAFYNQLSRRTTSSDTTSVKLYPKTYSTF